MSLEEKLQAICEEAGAELVCIKDGFAFFRASPDSDPVALPYRRTFYVADVRRALEGSVHGRKSTVRKMSARTRAKIARLKLGGGAVADQFGLTAALAMQIFSEGER